MAHVRGRRPRSYNGSLQREYGEEALAFKPKFKTTDAENASEVLRTGRKERVREEFTRKFKLEYQKAVVQTGLVSLISPKSFKCSAFISPSHSRSEAQNSPPRRCNSDDRGKPAEQVAQPIILRRSRSGNEVSADKNRLLSPRSRRRPQSISNGQQPAEVKNDVALSRAHSFTNVASQLLNPRANLEKLKSLSRVQKKLTSPRHSSKSNMCVSNREATTAIRSVNFFLDSENEFLSLAEGNTEKCSQCGRCRTLGILALTKVFRKLNSEVAYWLLEEMDDNAEEVALYLLKRGWRGGVEQ